MSCCQAERLLAPGNSFGSPAPRAVARRCACGRKIETGGECAECRERRLQTLGPQSNQIAQMPGESGSRSTVPPRQPMATGASHDFSSVRVHASPATDQSGFGLAKNKDASTPAPAPGATPPTPPAPAKAPACPVGKRSAKFTACIQPVVIAQDDGKKPTSEPSFAESKSIWAKCCITLTVNSAKTVKKTAYQTLDESKNDTPTGEQKALFKDAGSSSCVQVFVPREFAQGGKTGKDISGGGATYDAGKAHPKIVVVEGAVGEVVAHEVGHALGHRVHDKKPTVMKPTGNHSTANNSDVSKQVCRRAKRGSVLTKSGKARDCCMKF